MVKQKAQQMKTAGTTGDLGTAQPPAVDPPDTKKAGNDPKKAFDPKKTAATGKPKAKSGMKPA